MIVLTVRIAADRGALLLGRAWADFLKQLA